MSHVMAQGLVMVHPLLQELAARIDAAITASGYSGAEIARLMDVDRSAVSKWRTGERIPGMEHLIGLAELLGKEVTYFWTGPEAIPATAEEKMAIELMRNITLEQQQAILVFMKTMATKGEKT